MTTTSRALASLTAALQGGRERQMHPEEWASVARRFLDPEETVLLAFEGNGFTWWDPLLIVTDRRLLHLRAATFMPWRKIREVPAQEVSGAGFRQRSLWGPVIVRTRSGRRMWIRSDGDETAQRFVDGLNRLIAGG